MKTPWLTVWEVMKYLRASRDKVYKLCQRGKMPAHKFGGQWRFDVDEINEWIKSSTKKTGKKP